MHMKDCEDKPRDITPPTALCQRFTRLCLPLSPTPLFIPLLSFEAGQHNSLHQTTGGMMTRVSGPSNNPTATLVFYVLFHVALVLGQSAGSIPPQSPPHRFAQPDQTSEALRVTAPNWLSPLLCVYHQQQHWPTYSRAGWGARPWWRGGRGCKVPLAWVGPFRMVALPQSFFPHGPETFSHSMGELDARCLSHPRCSTPGTGYHRWPVRQAATSRNIYRRWTFTYLC